MISFNRRTKVFVCKEPTDMRASYDTLFAKAKGVLAQDPFVRPVWTITGRWNPGLSPERRE